jgi:hypothetical protein
MHSRSSGGPTRTPRVALLLGLLAATLAAVREAAQDTERLFELAQAAYRSTHR